MRDVSFAVAAGEIVGLIGINGAGKTSTLECLLGLRAADQGEIEICGIDARRRADVASHIGAVLQITALQDALTPREALHLFASLHAAPTQLELLDQFGLSDCADLPFQVLSGGQRQRLALALALINRPDVLVLDEPCAGLDPGARQQLHGLIQQLRGQGRAILLSTHDLEEARMLCDRILVMHRGQLIASGTPQELMTNTGVGQQLRVVSEPMLSEQMLLQLQGVQAVLAEAGGWLLQVSDPLVTLPALLTTLTQQQAQLIELHLQSATLQQAFLEMTAVDKSR
ncbi:MAG: ABC transporter ATP-binding protein [Steroidobacteraceae bacterium]